MSYHEQDYLLLSGLQHFEFCKRQWALIHIEQQWADNYQTALGEVMHKRAHDETSVEKRGNLIIMRGIRIFSPELGLSGQCDVVEFHKAEEGINLHQYEGLWSVVPIEYKKGVAKEGLEDKVQLCAQAICLEEMFLTEIPKGFLFYGENKRREEVCFTPELREHVRELSLEMHYLYERTHTPKVKTGAKCRACSLKDICIPKLNKKLSVDDYIQSFIHGDDLLRKEQYRISDDIGRSIKYARNMILGKIYNSRWSLERVMRDHSMRVNTEKIKSVSEEMKNSLVEISECVDAEILLGIEGKLASRYFHVFDELIINQKEEFGFRGRNRRPPLDYTNALLSFAYALLANSCADALEGVGLDAYVGFMHRDRPGRKSLALDFMEELRSVFADRFVLSLINKKMIKPEHFRKQADGAVLLKEEGRKIFLNAWQQRKKEKITHPFLKEKMDWGLVPHAQAMLLARTIRGDLEKYPPFLWK